MKPEGADAAHTLQLSAGDYVLKEVDEPDGYYRLSSEIYFRIGTDGSITMIGQDGEALTALDGAGNTVPKTEDVNWTLSGLTITIPNHTGSELPSTGGAGTLPFTIGGLFLMTVSLLCTFGRRRGREREAARK